LNTNDATSLPTVSELKEMPKSQLTRYMKKVQKVVDNYPNMKSAEVLPEVKKLLDAQGLTFDEFVNYLKKEGKIGTDTSKPQSARKPKKAKKPKNPAAPKYRALEDPTATWTGKGRRPTWFVDHLSKGGKPEDLLIA